MTRLAAGLPARLACESCFGWLACSAFCWQLCRELIFVLFVSHVLSMLIIKSIIFCTSPILSPGKCAAEGAWDSTEFGFLEKHHADQSVERMSLVDTNLARKSLGRACQCSLLLAPALQMRICRRRPLGPCRAKHTRERGQQFLLTRAGNNWIHPPVHCLCWNNS